MIVCPKCFGSGNWPWVQWGGPMVCTSCQGTGKISTAASAISKKDQLKNLARAFAKGELVHENRRDPDHPPRQGMTWSVRHGLWVDPDTRSPNEKASHEKIVADVESRKKEGDSK